MNEPRSNVYGESDMRSTNNVPFNSKINRDDYQRLNKQYNPGPGAYINVQKSSAFKNDFITKSNVAERKIFSQDQGVRSHRQGPLANTEQGLSVDAYGNPSYTIKDGGTLKKKLQPYAADKTSRDGLGITKAKLQQGIAPGHYDKDERKQRKSQIFNQKPANERLKEIGYLPSNLQMDQDQSPNTKQNYYAPEGSPDYLIGEGKVNNGA